MAAIDAEKLTMTSHRPRTKSRVRKRSQLQHFFKPFTASSGATEAAMLDKTESESPKTPSITLLH
jgi:hypothetical protein